MCLEKKFKEPFAANVIHWRPGSTNKDKTKCIALAYVDARDVMKRLDEAVGPENWRDSYEEFSSGRLICTLYIRIDGEWIGKSDGAGDSAIEGAKGGISDALKRAAVRWGIGRYLYYLPTKWVEMNKYRQIENPPALPSWALPKNLTSEKKAEIKGWQ